MVPELVPDPAEPPVVATQREAADRRARLSALRRSYARSALLETQVAADPMVQFEVWFDEAVQAGLTEPNAMVLGTVAADGTPSARTVLLKAVDPRGFVLYTNHRSRKGQEMLARPRASLVFPWFEIDRQVVVVGEVEAVPRRESEEYFATRPHDSQLGAWASEQSSVLPDRARLDARFAELAEQYPPGASVPTPPHWGGFRVVPHTLELWQGRASRLHDRLRYRRAEPEQAGGSADWVLERLAP
ncbi:pyridoxamine 5'-phosphate oxidase [Actinotalea sp. C106]|uniref:pyridoxamine 5'-phosphate oxidase n=1 Tax=Actinotalea sp. C106 TaxID=2908644 RepID=UPI002028863A|nr:pyridoxamine 5'-phosphate oxidase [Actinotalea sp. C106]